jgi:2-methylisocitrate lyase-like PEP mutase family enzyme
MSRARAALAARRQELIARSDAHREAIAGALGVWQETLERADRIVRIAEDVRRSAPWLGMALAAVMFAVPRGAAAWIGRAQSALSSIRSIVSIVTGPRG